MLDKSRLEWVKSDNEDNIPTKRKCELMGVARSSFYYKSSKTTKLRCSLSAEDRETRMKVIDRLHTALPAQGARKMARDLTKLDLPTSRYMAAVLMAEMNIYAIYPKPNLSKKAKQHQAFPYLLRNKKIWLPNQVWAIDITYVPFKGGHMYLTAVIDWYSRMIVGWTLADSLDAAPVVACMNEAFKNYGIPAIANSDQGAHFSSKAYIALLAKNGVDQSMDGKARWIDNVVIERWFRTLKSEYIYLNEFESPRELRLGIKDFIEKYNDLRSHETHDYQTPSEIWGQAYAQAA